MPEMTIPTSSFARAALVRLVVVVAVALAPLLVTQSSYAAPVNATGGLAEEFNGPAGSAPDASLWTHDIGRGPGNDGWGNGELQTYVDSRATSYLDGNGHLVIKARRTGADPQAGWTSARLTSKDKFETRYGRVESRMRIPAGKGMWPAFWMLGADHPDVPWPRSGEIDIMEASPGRNDRAVLSNVFGSAPTKTAWNDYTMIDHWHDLGQRVDADWHVYAVEWSPDDLRFFVDGVQHHRVTRDQMGEDWIFDKPFFLLLNLAVGGGFGGTVDASTPVENTMLVDYVRTTPRGTSATPSPDPGPAAIAAEYARRGGESGRLGAPVTGVACGLVGGGCFQHYANGASIYWSPGTGAHVVLGRVRAAYERNGWEGGRLGYPLMSEFCGLTGGGCFQRFSGGLIYWTPQTDAHVVLGAIEGAYARQGWESGPLGYPVMDEFCGLRDRGCYQRFTGGLVYWSPTTGAHPVWGGIGERYAAQGWENGVGYPVSGERYLGGGRWEQDFQRGRITFP